MNIFQENNEFIKLFSNTDVISEKIIVKKIKISLIGCGEIGGTCIASIIYTNLQANIALIEPIEENFGVEKKLFESLSYCNALNVPIQITCSNDIFASKNSDICIIAFEHTLQNIKKFSMNKLHDNISNFKKYIPQIIKYSPNVILIILTYPFTLLTHICYKIAKIPKHRIIGLGTILSTSEFRNIIAKKFDVSSKNVESFVIGLAIHNYKIPVWSTANVCGIRISSLAPLIGTEDDPLNLYHELISSDMKRNDLFHEYGPPRWTVGFLCSKICNAIVNDTKDVFTVPVNLKGIYGIKRKCCVSVPCTIGRNGIHSIMILSLNLKEIEQLKAVASLSNKVLYHYVLSKNDNTNKAALIKEAC